MAITNINVNSVSSSSSETSEEIGEEDTQNFEEEADNFEEEDNNVEEEEEEEEEDDDDDESSSNDENDADIENSGAEDEENESLSDNNDDEEEKSGWADAMAKVLNIGKASGEDSKKLLLTKARKDADVKIKNKKDSDNESEQDPKKEKTCKKSKSTDASDNLSDKKLLLRKKEIENIGRVKPDIVKDKAREKVLNKLATRGIVQLFNAVREQQKDLKCQLNAVGQSTRKRERIYQNIDKDEFLENVLGNTKKKPKLSSNEMGKIKVKKEMKKESQQPMDTDETQSTWNILRDDFMMGAKMKDWDKNSDSE